MRGVFQAGPWVWLVQRQAQAQRPGAVFGSLGVLLHAVPERVLTNHEQNGGKNDRPQ